MISFLLDEKGSIIVETTLVMFVVLSIVFAVIFLFIEIATESKDFVKDTERENMISAEADDLCTSRLRRWQMYGNINGD